MIGGASGRRGLLIGLAVPIVVLVLLVVVWAVDTSRADVVRNVAVGGRAVGGTQRSELEAAIEELATDYSTAAVRIVTAERTYESTAGDLGTTISQEATVDAALEEGRDEPLPLRPFTWLSSLFAERDVPLRFDVDRAVLAETLALVQGEDLIAPAEPSIQATPDGIVVVAGTPGAGIDPDEVAAALPEVAADGTLPIVVEAERQPLEPQFTDEQAQQVADQATELAARQLTVTVADESVLLPAETLRSWMRSVAGEGGLVLQVDQAAITESVPQLFPDSGQEPLSASFDVVGGQPVLIPGRDGTACCEPAAAEKILQALQANAGTVAVALVITPPELTTDEANALGIVEEVGRPDEFGPTTRHACCQPRVQNIHRIADIVRGQVILPGETFSLNGFVGERTTARGFVTAPVIYQGEYEDDVGGGVSQFATTTFNAAFFAGLDFGEYQSHSIAIDRYPRGREATISYPHPDLEIVNSTHYGVLLWPTYTDSSVTVHLYSTRNVEVSAGSTSDSRQGNCTRVTTPRTRTYADGRVENDSVFAVYRPGEGVDC
ncbi:VanW family protein [soil metagenome]